MDHSTSAAVLTRTNIEDTELENWLKEASENISTLDQKNENVVHLIFKLNWSGKSESVRSSYQELVLNLVTAYNTYLRPALKMITTSFNTVPVEESRTLQVNLHMHQLLQGIVTLIPSTSDHLLPMLAGQYPYMRKGADVQIFYLKNLFYVTEYFPTYRPSILELIISKILQIDVHCPREEIMESEDCEFDEMATPELETEESKYEMRNPLANTLDILLNELYQFGETSCFLTSVKDAPKKELDWENTKKIYKEFLAIFDAVILPTHACAHVQFIMLYMCSLHHLLCEGFVDYLWKKIQNPNISPVIRQAAGCYMGSFLARAKYVSIRMVHDCLKLMVSWVDSYIDMQSGSTRTYADAVQHSTFYTVCQVIFYLVTFRHKEMVSNKKGYQLLRELNLERIVNCRLNPLRISLPVVVKNFASVARRYQLAYCYTIMERNARLFVTTNQDISSADACSFQTLETFFPFDPYLLKRSGRVIDNLYRQYEGNQEDGICQLQPEAFMESMVLGSPQVHMSISDYLHEESTKSRAKQK